MLVISWCWWYLDANDDYNFDLCENSDVYCQRQRIWSLCSPLPSRSAPPQTMIALSRNLEKKKLEISQNFWRNPSESHLLARSQCCQWIRRDWTVDLPWRSDCASALPPLLVVIVVVTIVMFVISLVTKMMVDIVVTKMMVVISLVTNMMVDIMVTHTSYLSFFLHGQNFWIIKFTPKNANFSR